MLFRSVLLPFLSVLLARGLVQLVPGGPRGALPAGQVQEQHDRGVVEVGLRMQGTKGGEHHRIQVTVREEGEPNADRRPRDRTEVVKGKRRSVGEGT